MTLHANIIIFMAYMIFVFFLVWFKREKIKEYKKLPWFVKVALAPAAIVVCVGAAYFTFFHGVPWVFNMFSFVFKSFWFWFIVVACGFILLIAEVCRNEKALKEGKEKPLLVQDFCRWLFKMMVELLNAIEKKQMAPTKMTPQERWLRRAWVILKPFYIEKDSKIKDKKSDPIAKVASVVSGIAETHKVPNPHKKQKRPKTQLELSQAQAKLKQEAEARKNKPVWTLVEDSE